MCPQILNGSFAYHVYGNLHCIHIFLGCMCLCYFFPFLHWKTKHDQFENLAITGCNLSCHYDTFHCHQWWLSSQTDNLLFSVWSSEITLWIMGFWSAFEISQTTASIQWFSDLRYLGLQKIKNLDLGYFYCKRYFILISIMDVECSVLDVLDVWCIYCMTICYVWKPTFQSIL